MPMQTAKCVITLAQKKARENLRSSIKRLSIPREEHLLGNPFGSGAIRS
jgi:hypothetical protein